MVLLGPILRQTEAYGQKKIRMNQKEKLQNIIVNGEKISPVLPEEMKNY